MKNIFLKVFILTALCTIIASCTPSKDEPQNVSASADVTESSTAITISGALGDVTLDAPAIKVVVLEYSYTEHVLAAGIEPVGVADIEGYNKWVKIGVNLSDNVVDVGTRQEPNLEVVASLEPDLIIAVKSRHEGIKSQLESIAPTVYFDAYPTDESMSQYDEMERTFKEIAKAVGKEDEAKAVLAELNTVYENAKIAIDNANLSTKDFLLTQSYSSNQAPQIRLFAKNALASVILEKIGLNNVYTSEAFEVYGFSTVNVEALTKLEEANYIYVVADDDNIYETLLKNNQVWNGLAFVKENRTYPLGGDAWLFGGPLSAEVIVGRVLDNVITE